MNMLASLTTSADIAEEKDTLGGGRQLFDSGIYKFTVALAYVKAADSGALGLHLQFKTEDGRELRQSVYLTSGKEKGLKNYYEKEGQKHYLPGFNIGNSLALLTTGKEISQLETEDKVFNLYDFNAKAEVPTKVAALTDIMGKEIYGAVLLQKVDKNVKDNSGKYVPSGETREENEIDKFFCAVEEFDKLTSAEIKAKRAGQTIEKPFYDAWSEKNAGQVRDKSTKGGGTAGAPGAAKPAAAASAKPSTSLFG